ncbi:hypothetical protein MAR_035876 [Mya arenaria]|uniref:Uncharacterized protein n=1 Tax=Mya arenaria TaxID=6604 RepID=A0ABY7ELV3_MYAAR|nr:hypothetical protein MAR_035876 [Mya arenaria]
MKAYHQPEDVVGERKELLGNKKKSDGIKQVSSSCSRMLLKCSVVYVDNVSFKASDKLLTKCLSHRISAENKEWLCQTCLRYIRANKMPPQLDANNLNLPSIPVAATVNFRRTIVITTISIHEDVRITKRETNCNERSIEVDTIAEILPRTLSEAGFIPLKLKRKVENKGHYSFQYIRPDKVRSGLKWLIQNNVLYSNNTFGKRTWQKCIRRGQLDEFKTEEIVPISNDPSQNVQFETCVQPTDMSIDASRILSIDPGEGKGPLAIFSDKNFEELSSPTLFPCGKFGYTYQRPVKLRILEKGGHFASNIEYLFLFEAQFITEWNQILSSTSIALRISGASQNDENYNAAFFKNTDRIRPLLTKDDAYRFLRPIRGSPSYWQKVMYEL